MTRHNSLSYPAFCLGLMLWVMPAASLPVLQQIHVVTRHGARTPLAKNADTLQEQAGSTLTPLGQKQLYDLGVWLRDTYNANGFLDDYDASQVRLESSNLDRTLSSANALSLGLFPYDAHVGNHADAYDGLLPSMPSLPVYSRQEANDIYLRAYHEDNCPKYQDNLQNLYASPEWNDFAESYDALLTTLATTFPEEATNGKVGLKHIWSLYDKIHVARTECIPDATAFACQSLEDPSLRDALSESDFDNLETLVGFTESIKFGVGPAGSMLGSNLLWLILERAVEDGNFKFFLYSAHAATLMGLLTTIDGESSGDFLPDYGSAVIVEVYKDSGTNAYSLRFLYKASDNNEAQYIPLTHVNCDQSVSDGVNDVVHCQWTKFTQWAKSNTITSEDDWCEACENDTADVCLAAKVDSGLFGNLLDDEKEGVAFAATFFGGLLAGMVVLGLCCGGCRRVSRNTKEELDHTVTSEDGGTTPVERSESPTLT